MTTSNHFFFKAARHVMAPYLSLFLNLCLGKESFPEIAKLSGAKEDI